jgi:hypothetical protein
MRAPPYAVRVLPSSPPAAAGDLDPAVGRAARTVRLRREAIWAAIGCFLAFLVVISIYSNKYDDATDSGPGVVLAIAMVFGALTIGALIVIVAASVQLGRRTGDQRARAIAYAGQQRAGKARPGRYRWAIAPGLLVVALGAAVLFLPGLVNGVGYLTSHHVATFVPQSHDLSCSYHGNGNCSIVTIGLLESGSHAVNSTWPHDVPLNRPFRVREPIWTWGLGSALIDSDGIAIGAALISLLFIGFAVFAAVHFIGVVLRRRDP